jgi:hypothetical protein
VVDFTLVEVCTAEEIDILENEYKDLPEAVHCSIAGCRTLHKKGYVAVLRSGAKARIGHICGKNLLGDVIFGKMQRDLGQRQERERRERIITSCNFNPRSALDALGAWQNRLAAMSMFVRQLGSVEHNIVTNLRIAATRHDGRLTANGNIIHVLRGAGWLRGSDPVRYFVEAKASIGYSVNLLDKAHLTNEELEKVVSEAGRAASFLRLVADALDDFDGFCHPENIVGIAQWLSATHKVEVSGPALLRIEKWWPEEIIDITIPDQRGPVDRKPIEQLGAG